jgi:hypothetical protein
MALWFTDDTGKPTMRVVVTRIVQMNDHLRSFWSEAEGWAPLEAAQLLTKSRLDRQVSLSRCLNLWTTKPSQDELDGVLILGWANLGSLVEGTLKLFLSVFYKDYEGDIDAIRDRKSKLVDPDGLMLEPLKQFFQKKIWTSTQDKPWIAWIDMVQQRRNSIHAFKDRGIGTRNDLLRAIRKYLVFLTFVDHCLPYP